MANGQQQLHRRTLETRSSADDEEEELELELELKQMAESILHHRTTLPDRLNKTFDLLLATQRLFLPPPPSHMTPESGTRARDQNPDVGDNDELSKGALLEAKDPETAEKIQLLKLKISSNISAIPIILKRMKEAISRIDKLDLQKGSIHPAFKRKRTTY